MSKMPRYLLAIMCALPCFSFAGAKDTNSKTTVQAGPGAPVTLNIQWGRKSRFCRKAGICFFRAGEGGDAETRQIPRDRLVPAVAVIESKRIILALKSAPPEKGDAVIIDEDVSCPARDANSLGFASITMLKGSYTLSHRGPGFGTLIVAARATPLKQSRNPSAELRKVKGPNYSCYRHIYNNTGCSWTFFAYTYAGNVWYLDEGTACKANCTNPNGPCTLPPNCTVEIQYTTTGGQIGGFWFAIDQNGRFGGPWAYGSPQYRDTCPYISHNGDTGAVSLNDPANGDLHATGCTWSAK